METPLPVDFCERIRLQFPDGNDLLSALDTAPVTSIRLHPEKIRWIHGTSLFPDATAVAWNALGRVLHQRPSFSHDPLYHAGVYYPQESSSMFVRHVLECLFGKEKHLTALDLCAAPGGKSIELIDFLGQEGRVISNEIIRGRNAVLRENLSRHGLANFIVTNAEASHLSVIAAEADIVLIDAPCSGEGMFRKDQSARTEWSIGQVNLCSRRQKDIVSQVAPYMKKGSVIIYSTCTFAPEENDLQTEHTLGNKEWEHVRIPLDGLSGPVYTEKGVAFLPHRVPGEGFYIAAFRKLSDGILPRDRKPRVHFRSLHKKELILASQLLPQSHHRIVTDPEGNWFVSPFSAGILNTWAAHAMISLPGTPLGRWMVDQFLPAHEWALSVQAPYMSFPSVELSEDQALDYLRLGTDLPSLPTKGVHLITHRGAGLGWAKNLGNRWNNQLPREWKLRR
jgi:16S rRNA C967 or C1407 C5-methylase (RsmB/RsmF family)/NOL1/NOP2/fmu family ribosome biogenesis protein